MTFNWLQQLNIPSPSSPPNFFSGWFNSWNNFQPPMLWNFQSNYSFDIGDKFICSKKSNYKATSLKGYNAKAGQSLAKDILNHAVGFTKRCAAFVSNALKRTGLSNGLRGNGYQMIDVLRKNKNFKELSVDNLDYKNLPAGCILVYGRGAQGYSKQYGHVEITTGDGRAASDGITCNIRKPTAVFMPVDATSVRYA